MFPTWFNATFVAWGWIVGLGTGIVINSRVMTWALRKNHLTTRAAFTAFIIGLILWMIEPLFFLVLLIFFASSSFLSKLHASKKKDAQDRVAKGSTRDVDQVLANGSAGFIAAIIYMIAMFTSFPSWVYMAAVFSAIAAFAAPNADTWATEIGMFSRSKPRWILDLRKVVEPGTSGGVTIKGTGAAATGALIVAGTGFLLGIILGVINGFDPRNWIAFVVVACTAFLGSIVDSIIGATVQATFRCQTCGKETEKRIHCSKPTVQLRGTRWIDNDTVNFLASTFAGAITFVVVAFMFAW